MNDMEIFGDLPTLENLSHPLGRSMLFSLAPISSPQLAQESLVSFLVRTSRAHLLNPRRVIGEVLAAADPEIRLLSYAGFFRHLSRTMNGLGRYAEIFVAAFEKAACVKNLRALTMLPWKDFFPHNGQGMLARHPRWCPACLAQQRLEKKESFFPLAWALEAVTVCPIHRTKLRQTCPHCGKAQPFIPRYPDLGICNECLRPLAVPSESAMPDGAEFSTDFEHWIAESVSGLIARHASGEKVAGAGDFRTLVADTVERITRGNRSAFCKAIGFPRRGLDGWLTKDERPSMTMLLRFCYGIGMRPAEIGRNRSQCSPLLVKPRYTAGLKCRRPCPRFGKQKREELRMRLTAELRGVEGIPLRKVASNMGVRVSYLRYWFPRLCAAVTAQYRNENRRRSRAYQAVQSDRVADIVNQLVNAGRYPSRRRVNVVLRREKMALAQPHLFRAYGAAKKRYMS